MLVTMSILYDMIRFYNHQILPGMLENTSIICCLILDLFLFYIVLTMLHYINKIEESQRELLQAREMIDEAQRSLSSCLEEGSFGDVSSGDIDEDSERLESVKAAAVSSIVGVLASLPISFYEVQDLSQLFLQTTVVFISCALFGVTFRYAVRRDLDNTQLKTGAPAAFAFVRGISRQHGF